MPRISVVVPVYNVEKYLNQCIDSILGQSFSDFELIIVNDGSTDDSGSICDQYAMADPRVRVIHTENRGVVTARRTGVNMARGEYTVFVDSDDWLDLDFYRCLIEGGEGMNADILISGNLKRAAGCVKTTVFPSGYYDKKMLENTIFPKMMYDMRTEQYTLSPSLWDKLFRTELLKEVYEGVDPRVTLGEDAVCTYPCIARANSVLILDNSACYHYREDHVSMVNQRDIRLLQRVSALAINMNQQFNALTEAFNIQAQCYVACVGMYAATQVLLYNRELWLAKRLSIVKDFFRQTEMANAIREARKFACTKRYKWKLFFATIIGRAF